MKKVIIIGLVLVALVVAAFVGLTYIAYKNIDKLVIHAVETEGSAALGVPVTLERVELALSEAQATLYGLRIANPPGFEEPYLAEFPQLAIAIGGMAKEGYNAHLAEVRALSAKFVVEQHADGANNVKALLAKLDELDAAAAARGEPVDEEPFRMRIDELIAEDAELLLVAPLIDEGRRSTTIDEVRVRNLEGDKGEIAVQTARKLLEDLERTAKRRLVRDKIEEKKGELEEKLKGKLKDLLGD